MSKDLPVRHEYKDAENDHYRKLLQQLVSEDELEGIIVITVEYKDGELRFGTRTCAKAGADAPPMHDMGDWATQGIIQTIQFLRRMGRI